MSHAAIPISTYRAAQTGTNQVCGAAHGGFTNIAYHCAAAPDPAGENRDAKTPTPSASPTNSASAGRFGRELRPRYVVALSIGILISCATSTISSSGTAGWRRPSAASRAIDIAWGGSGRI